MINRLNAACFGRMGHAINIWKEVAFDKLRNYHDKLMARCFDRLIRSSMSDIQRTFLKWTRIMFGLRLILHGDRVKAGYILQNHVKKTRGERDRMLKKFAWDRMLSDPSLKLKRCI